MIHPIIQNLLVLSAMGSGVAIVMLILRRLIGKNAGAWWRSLIWVMLLLRLCLPLMLETPIGIANNPMATPEVVETPVVDTHSPTQGNTVGIGEPEIQPMNPMAHADEAMKQKQGINWYRVVDIVYLVGLMASLSLFGIRVLMLKRRIARLKPCEDEAVLQLFNHIKRQMGIKRNITLLLRSGRQVPALCGMVHPCIILSKRALDTTNVTELSHIIRHELTHYKQRDIMKLWLIELTLCLHWFNPIIYFVRPIMVQDIELACDERVLMQIGRDNFLSYGQVLVKSSVKTASKRLMVTTHFAGKRGSKLKERLHMIQRYHKGKIIALGIVVALLLATVLVACTTTLADKPEETVPESTPDKVEITSTPDPNTSEPTAQISNTPEFTPTPTPYGIPFSERRISLLESEGNMLKHLIETVEGVYPVMDTIEEFCWDKGDGIYKISLYTNAYNYWLTLQVADGDLGKKLDYSRCNLKVENVQGGWILENPSAEELREKIYDPFKIELKEWKDTRPYTKRGNYIDVYMCNQPSERIMLDDEIAETLTAWLKDSDFTINAMEEADSRHPYYDQGIHVHLDGMKPEYEYGVPLFTNDKGVKIIGAYNADSPVCHEAYDKIVEIIEANTGWYYVSQREIHDLVSVELVYDDRSIKTITDSDALKGIDEKLSNAQRMGGGAGCPFSAKLIMKRADGTEVSAWLATDSCSVMVLGSSEYYEYDKGSGASLASYFGYESFYDLHETSD